MENRLLVSQQYFTVISFLVIVPVLSLQITLTRPRLSTAERSLIITPFLAIAKTPVRRTIVVNKGILIGIIVIARVIPAPILSDMFCISKSNGISSKIGKMNNCHNTETAIKMRAAIPRYFARTFTFLRRGISPVFNASSVP